MTEAKTASLAPSAKNADGPSVRLQGKNPWLNAWKIALGVGILGVGISIGAGAMGGEHSALHERFAFSYLFAFQVTLSIALGSVFFILIQHLSSAGWSVTVRRTAEFLASGLVVMAVLFIPVWLCKGTLYPWWNAENAPAEHHASNEVVGTTTLTSHQTHGDDQVKEPEHGEHAGQGEHAGHHGDHAEGAVKHDHATGHDPNDEALEAEEHHLLAKKRWWLNHDFFNGRAVLYFLVWAFLGWTLYKRSVDQDKAKDFKTTNFLKAFSTIGTILFALSLTFAGVDWIMSLQPMWFSTIFGVYLFAGSFVAALATIILVTLGLRKSGVLLKEITVEHYHDLGKLMFGFNVFWAYIAFSQMMLIWYAGLPEETPFYHIRWFTDEVHHKASGWQTVSLALLGLHFAAPFVFLISRNIKRRLQLLGVGAALILTMHIVDIYWLIFPNLRERFEVSLLWLDIAALIGVASLYFAFVLHRMTKNALIPIGDPRLARALTFENA